MADFTQYAPMVEGLLLGTMQIIGGAKQQQFDNALADNALRIAAQDAAQQKKMNRIIYSAGRAASLTAGTDSPNLDILTQLALEGNLRVNRILDNGNLTAAYYRNIGDQALYESLGSAAYSLGQGFANAYERGAFTKGDPWAPMAPSRSGASILSSPQNSAMPQPGGGSTTLPAWNYEVTA